MSDEEYRHIAITQTEIIEKLQPKYWLVDIAQLRFTLVPETQEWADMVLFPRIIKAGVSFIAFVISEDLFAQISVEQLMDEKNVKTANFEIKYFDKQEDATQWLLSTSRH